jgi:hypothetical protein
VTVELAKAANQHGQKRQKLMDEFDRLTRQDGAVTRRGTELLRTRMVATTGEVVSRLDLCPPVFKHDCENDDFPNPLPSFIETVQAAQARLLIGDLAKTQGVVRGDRPISAHEVGDEDRRGGASAAEVEDAGESTDSEAPSGATDGAGEFEGDGEEPTRLVSFFGTTATPAAAAAPQVVDADADNFDWCTICCSDIPYSIWRCDAE